MMDPDECDEGEDDGVLAEGVGRGVVDEEAEEEGGFGEAVEGGVHECAAVGNFAGSTGDGAVDHVE